MIPATPNRGLVDLRRTLVTQRHPEIDTHSAAGGNVAGGECDGAQQHGYRNEGQRVSRLHPEKQVRIRRVSPSAAANPIMIPIPAILPP